MKKTSKDWCAEIPSEFGFVIMDPDGWQRDNYEFSFNQELITKKEFFFRVLKSTSLSNKPTTKFFVEWLKEN